MCYFCLFQGRIGVCERRTGELCVGHSEDILISRSSKGNAHLDTQSCAQTCFAHSNATDCRKLHLASLFPVDARFSPDLQLSRSPREYMYQLGWKVLELHGFWSFANE